MQAQQQQAVLPSASQPPPGFISEAEAQRRLSEAVAAARAEADARAAVAAAQLAAAVQAASASAAAATAGVSEEEAQRRVEEATADLKAQVADSEEQMTDLLVCLGQVRAQGHASVSISQPALRLPSSRLARIEPLPLPTLCVNTGPQAPRAPCRASTPGREAASFSSTTGATPSPWKSYLALLLTLASSAWLQEEQKVAVLSERLTALGVDVEGLLASIKPEEGEGS
jgi:hypothetical protein